MTMASCFILILSAVLVASTIGRPSQMDETDERDSEEPNYEGDDEASAEETGQDEESSLSNQDASDLEEEESSRRLVKMDQEKYQQRSLTPEPERDGSAGSELFPEYMQKQIKGQKYDEAAKENDNLLSLSKRRQPNKYIDSSDVNDQSENVHLTHYKTNRVEGDERNNDGKRTIDSHVSGLDNSMYEANRKNRNNAEIVEYNNEAVDSSEQGRHLKRYYNEMQSEGRRFENINRDRRQAEQTNTVSSSTSTDKSNEDDEAAIKRHIRKLSSEELEELLNSLSDDKKALLNKIMDDDSSYDTLNKREITKKAGAVEENGYIDSSLSDISKVQAGNAIDINTESSMVPITVIDDNKQKEIQTESIDTSNHKISDATKSSLGDKADLSDDANNNLKSDSNINSLSDPSEAQFTKSENKREANSDEVENSENTLDDSQYNYFVPKDSDNSFNDPGHICSQDDELAQLMEEEAWLHNNNEHQYKREVLDNKADLEDSMKSLEDSFPNSNYEENGNYLGSNMAPLIRVKRKNDDAGVIKRAAVDMPESKVAYFPNEAENDDDDNEEGSEFDDNGFYDRTSSCSKNDANILHDKSASYGALPSKLYNKQRNPDGHSLSDDSSNYKKNSDVKLGSDTDSVLSGVEGVDENLMYSAGSRNKRTLEDERFIENEQNRPLRSTPFAEDIKSAENHLPNYQENDYFGPILRNEANLGRYKRIRRVKPSPSSDVTAG